MVRAAGTDLGALLRHLKPAGATTPAIMVDCTANAHVAALVPTWMRAGVHVVTPNKKAFAGELALWDEVHVPPTICAP
jgi:homoserine dehydrogenase